MSTEPPKQRRSLTHDKVVAEAFRLADAQGIDGLSMRALAGALGVTPMSLYNHVANKDALLDALVDGVVAEITRPEIGGDWQGQMRARAISMYEALIRHPWAAVPLISRITMGEASLADMNATTGCLVTAGFSYPQADWAKTAIDSHVFGYALQVVNYPVTPEGFQEAAAEHMPAIPAETYPFLHEAARQIADHDYDGKTSFAFGLDLILEGLAAGLERGA